MKYQSLSITLTKAERKFFEDIVKKDRNENEKKRASILLAVDESENRIRVKDTIVANREKTTVQTVCRVKKDFLNAPEGESAIRRKKRKTPPVPARITSEIESHIVSICIDDPPAGCRRWSLRLIADKAVELGYIDAISHTTVGKILKKNKLDLV
ncbi:hypothetical protein SpiGrapes_2357 [Sphaerochaeta pleomorpha str. Grapes]|uniref:Transposase n=1 Tax=Sphaerochaeta pleomorpha (strain ATCC BAA-1885 / DSM 22778 / Grapes) TaxID=158190 RepID=G8QSU9_SPHPG|nr:helix-turn-helix domain-containing protein [Sphaerochaeta pleomorpha]AEV30131.1 hypothetical protein SpiGrapes_2357 [Sphaerochaeta pleomorpha str. Grapes]